MNLAIGAKPPGWFRIAALLALLWNLIGVYFYLVHVGAVSGPAMSDADRALAETMPAWVTACFALGVFGGTLGSLGLLVQNGWARLFLLVSLIALALEHGWYLFVSGAPGVLGPSAVALPVTILAVALLLVWLASRAIRKGWLR